MSNVSFQVARMEQELFYLNGFRAGVEGTELPPGSADEFARGYGAGSVERAAKERARALDLHLSGMRQGLIGADVRDTPTCAELDAGRDEGMDLREKILASVEADDDDDDDGDEYDKLVKGRQFWRQYDELQGYQEGVRGYPLNLETYNPKYKKAYTEGWKKGKAEWDGWCAYCTEALTLRGVVWGVKGGGPKDAPGTGSFEVDRGRDEGLKLRAEILASASAPAESWSPTTKINCSPCFNCKVPLWIDTKSYLVVDEYGPHSCNDSLSKPADPDNDQWGSTVTARFRVESKEWLPVLRHRVHLPVAAEVSVGAHGSLDHFEGDLAVMVDGVVSEMSERRRYTKERSGFKLGGVATLLAGDHDIALVARGAGVVGKRTVYVEVRSVLSKPPEPLTDAEIVALRKLIGGV